jgi:hypothetical protein
MQEIKKVYDNAEDIFEQPIYSTFEEMDKQARINTCQTLREAREDFKGEFGKDSLASDDHGLVSALMQTRGRHLQTLILSKILQEGFTGVVSELETIAERIHDIHVQLKEM